MKKRILLVYPKFPQTYWGFNYSLKFIGKKSVFPPLGLITVAAMIPHDYAIKLVNLNTAKLDERDIAETDFVFISAMVVQKESFDEIVRISHKYNKIVVAGGPYPTVSYMDIEGVDHFILDEAEMTLPKFFSDLEKGHLQKIYRSAEKPEMSLTPIPRFDIINVREYSSMALQFSRGCPYNCEFCDIIELFGRVPRTKSAAQFIAEVETLYSTGYRGSIFIVDDNFIGNKIAAKELLRSLGSWQKRKKFPFAFMTEASVNLAADDELMNLMIEAGFYSVFIGIETPSEESLKQTKKPQNIKAGLLESVRKIQSKGIDVTAGFILGFDTDRDDIFERQISFITDSAIPMAMVGLLTALTKTQLYRRLLSENRIIKETSGNNTHDLELNFIPKMPADRLIEGYKKVISTIYDPGIYFKRCYDLIMRLPEKYRLPIDLLNIPNIIKYGYALVRSFFLQGFSPYGLKYFKFIAKVIMSRPARFPDAVQYAIVGYHFFKITDKQINNKMARLSNFKIYINRLRTMIQERIRLIHEITLEEAAHELFIIRKNILSELNRKYNRASKLSKQYTESTLGKLEENIGEYISNIGLSLKDAINKSNSIKAEVLLKDVSRYLDRMLRIISENITEAYRFDSLTDAIDKIVLDLQKLITSKTESGVICL